jgi:hypothetical protein
MTRTNNNFWNIAVIIFAVSLIAFVFTGSANAGINHDRDNDLTDGAELHVVDSNNNDVAELSILPNLYTGFAGLTAIIIHSAPQGLEGEVADFWWNLHTQGSENWDGMIVLHYNEDELNGIPEEELTLNHYDGDEWVDLGGVVDAEANTITASVLRDDFSPYALTRSENPGATGGNEYGYEKEGQLNNTLTVPENSIDAINYPNPFNPVTTISFELPEASNISLVIYDVSGKVVKTFVENEWRSDGEHTFTWEGTNDNGEAVASGIYLYQLVTETESVVKQMTLLK